MSASSVRMEHNWSDNYGCRFVASIDEVACPICRDVVKDAIVTSCCEGHFCNGCIRSILDAKSNCPLCREANFDVVPSKKYSLKVQSIDTYCKMKGMGCSWTGPLREMAAHMDAKDGSCRFVDVECPNKCGKWVIRDNLPLHLQVACSQSEFVCPYCRKKLTRGEATHHLATCPAHPLPCPNLCRTGTRLQRCQIATHLLECPLQPLECEFFYAGCRDKIKRKDVAKHMADCTQEHMLLLSTSMKKKFEQQEEALREKSKEIELLRSELCSLRTTLTVPPLEFVIANHAQYFVLNKDWSSSDFCTHVGGYLLCLHATKKEGCRLILSLKAKEGNNDKLLPWPCSGSLNVQVTINDTNTISKTVAFSLPPKDMATLLAVRTPQVNWKNDTVKFCVLRVELS